ncbi:MAG: efflux RND transporter periplasmic adaptor subunit [Saprospiraceae bacterium]
MKKQIHILLFALMTLWACNQQEEESPTVDLAAPVSVMEIKTASLSRHTIATGNAIAEKMMDLNASIGGKYIMKNHPTFNRPFQLGDRVKVGQAFIEIEDKEYVNSIGLESVKMNLDLAKQEYEKQKSVYDKGGVTLRELRNAELQLTQAQNDLESAEIRLEKMKVDFPITGVIVELPHYTQNSQIQQGAALAKIMDYSTMYVDVSLPENTMAEIKTGQKVQITNYSLPNDTLIGTVTEMSPAIDVNTRTYLGKVRFNNPKLLIRPGMFVKTLIKVNQKNDIIVIPKEVIISDQRGKRVFVVNENTAFERIIETGLENEEMIEVVSGLEENERLVIKGFETLRDKSKVKVLK